MTTEPELLTIEQWLKKTNELGYFITQPKIIYEPKDWKAAIEFASIIVAFGCFVGLLFAGLEISMHYFNCGVHR